MTAANGTYTDCGPAKNFSLVFDCTGPGCTGFQTFPNLRCVNITNSMSLHCTNDIICESSNFTSVFSVKADNSTANVTENIALGNSQIVFTENSMQNASFTNNTSPSSTAKSSGGSSRGPYMSKLTLFFILLLTMMASSVHAQAVSPLQTESNIQASIPAAFQPILSAVEQKLCTYAATLFVEGGVIVAGGEELAPLLAKLKVMCENAMWEVEISTGVAEAALAVPWGAGIIALGLTDFIACNQIVNKILLPQLETGEDSFCSMILSQSSSAATPSSSAALSLPIGSALSQDPCVSCMLSLYAMGVEGLAQQCNVATPLGFANDLSVTFCDPSIESRYSQLCTTLCANPCATYNILVWVQMAGSGFMSDASLPLCNQLCPGFQGTGRCTTTPPCMECGVGSGTCVPC
jgi:hypothetical protein